MTLDDSDGITTLTATYLFVWPTNRGSRTRDEEEISFTWEFNEQTQGFMPQNARTRFHYRPVEFNLPSSDYDLVVIITNPAHTPMLPGSYPRYVNDEPSDVVTLPSDELGMVDVFTIFSGQKWAGSSLALGLPHNFGSLDINVSGTFIDNRQMP